MTEAEIDALARRLAAGERRALARAITLAESTRPDHRAATRQLLQLIGQVEAGGIRIGQRCENTKAIEVEASEGFVLSSSPSRRAQCYEAQEAADTTITNRLHESR